MDTRPTPIEFAAQIDAAKARADAMRQQAIGDAWAALGHALLRTWHAAGRWMPRRRAATIAR
jgi:hypothetical protein